MTKCLCCQALTVHCQCCANSEGATVCPRDLTAWTQHSKSSSNARADSQPALVSAFSMVWPGCSPGTVGFETLLFDNSRGCQLWVLQTWNSHERLFKVPHVWTMSLLGILFKILASGVFLFSLKLAFPQLGNVEFSWFLWHDARLLILFLYFISLNFLRWIPQLMAHGALHWEHRMHQQLWHYYELLFLHSCCLVFCKVPLKCIVQVSGSFQ